MLNKNLNDIFKYMDILINEAKKVNRDIPVAAMVIKDGEIISLSVNQKEKDNLVTSHAEILALNEANKKLKSWRLNDCDLFVTLEPCPMCAWAIINAKIKNVYFGSYDINYGALGGAINLANLAKSDLKVYGGIKEKECNELLKEYFKKMRAKNETKA